MTARRTAVAILTPAPYRPIDMRAPLPRVAASSHEVAESLEVAALRLVARRQLEQARRGAAEDIVLCPLGQERQVPDRARQVEVPVRIVRCVQKLGFRIDHA